MARLLLDLRPLRESRPYRILWCGQLVSYLGRQVTVVAVPVQVYELTESSLAVGLVGLAALGPLVLFSVAGGALADAVDRRRVLVVVTLAQAATSAGLALNAARDRPALWPLYVLTALTAGLTGMEQPTRSAVVPNLVRRDLLPAAVALSQTLLQTGQVAGPALAGVLIGRAGLAAAYWVDVATFGAALAAAALLPAMPPEGGGRRPGLASIGEGLAYLKSQRLLQGTFWVDLGAMVFGMPRALFPALADRVFGGGAATVGLLTAAPAAGALAGALTAGWVGGVHRQGRAVLWAVAVWGAAVAAFGLVPWLPAALALLAVAGAADVVSAVFRNTILQSTVPDSLRGRLSAVHIAVVTGGPRLGDAEAGAVAALAGVRFSVVSGGLACLAGLVAVARLFPELGRYDARPAEAEGGTTTLGPTS